MTKMMVAVNRRGGADRTGNGSVGEHSFTYFPHDYFFWGTVNVILFGRPGQTWTGELPSP